METDEPKAATGMESAIDFYKPRYISSIMSMLINILYDRTILILLEASGCFLIPKLIKLLSSMFIFP